MNQTLATLIDRVAWDGGSSHRVGLIVIGWSQPLDLVDLIRDPCRFEIDGSSCVRIAPGLRALAQLGDPVVDRAASWLLTVSCLAGGETVRRDVRHVGWLPRHLGHWSLLPLTDEGRAWLVHTAVSLIADAKLTEDLLSQLVRRLR